MPWDPMRDLLTMQERLESLFGRAQPGWIPAVDLAEYPDRYELSVELPGLKRENVHVEYRAHTLTIHGQRPGQTCCPERYLQVERGQGAFARAFQFAAPVEGDAITADLADGILTVIIPKTARTERQIDIA